MLYEYLVLENYYNYKTCYHTWIMDTYVPRSVNNINRFITIFTFNTHRFRFIQPKLESRAVGNIVISNSKSTTAGFFT